MAATQRTVRQQVNEFRDALVEQQDLHDWLEDTWSDLLETETMADLMVCRAEEMLYTANRGTKDGTGGVTLYFRQNNLDVLLWLISRVWNQVNDAQERVLVRLNAVTQADNEANDPRILRIKQHTIDDGKMIDCIDQLRNALDRMEAMDALVKQLPKGHQPAMELVAGDIHDLVTKAFNTLYAVREKAGAA